MEERNELNDIILNRGGDSSGSSKKIILAVAILTIVLIVAVLIMKSSGSGDTSNLPQTPQTNTKTNLPPEPPTVQTDTQDTSLFKPVEVVKENKGDDDLDKIASKLKQESLTQEAPSIQQPVQKPMQEPVKTVETPKVQETVKPVKKVETPKAVAPKKVSHPASGKIYIQVGAFSHYAPDKKFLDSIRNLGYMYTYDKVTKNGKTINKVLVGPFVNESDARAALKNIRAKIVSGAFITKK